MERIAFIVESTSERIGALLNPDALVVRRQAGVRPRQSAGGQLAGAGLADDPLLYTGGGRLELDLQLLFDVELADLATEDVRELTAPLWQLAENSGQPSDSSRGPQIVRFVWGKSWNVRGVVSAVAERLERFTAAGMAQRSWLSLRLLRVAETAATSEPTVPTVPPLAQLDAAAQTAPGVPAAHQVIGGGGDVGESLYDLAYTYYGNPGMWRLIASFNGITDPLRVAPGTLLRIPPLPGGGGVK